MCHQVPGTSPENALHCSSDHVLSISGAVGAGEIVSPCESGDNIAEPSVLEEQRGPLPLNKTLFLGYAFLLTMATTSDKLSSRSKLQDLPTGSSEEEEGEALGSPRSYTCTFFIFIYSELLVPLERGTGYFLVDTFLRIP